MTKSELKQKLKDALIDLIEKDYYLIEHKVHEQAISSKLSCYLSCRIPNRGEGGWDIDVEYNRNGETPKTLNDRYVKPDIIVHRRGLNNTMNSEDNNLMIIELKKNPSLKRKIKDLTKIKAFINDYPFHYCFGAFISLSSTENEKFNIEWFERS